MVIIKNNVKGLKRKMLNKFFLFLIDVNYDGG